MKLLKTRSFDNILFIVKHIYKWKKSIFISIGLYSIFYAISPFIWIYVPKFLIDEILGEARSDVIIKILVIALVVSAIVSFSVEYLQADFRMKMNAVRYNFIHMLSEKAMKMRFQFTEDSTTLDEMNIARQTVTHPQRGIGVIITKLFSIFGLSIGFIGFVVILFKLNPMVLVVLMTTILLSYFVIVKANNYERSRKDDKSFFQRKSGYASMTLSDFRYGKDLRIYRIKDLILSKKKESDQGLIGVVSDVERYKFKASIVQSVLFLIREGYIYGYLIYGVLNKGLTIADFVMYSVAMNSFSVWMETTLKDIADIKATSLYVNDFRDFLNKEEPVSNGDEIDIPMTNQYEIEFDHVSFKYPNSERYIFKDFSLKIKKGERLAIVGINGAGKTTLVKLLTRLYKPTKGVIRINGIDIEKFKGEDYWNLFSVVFQDVHVFPFSVRENITFSDNQIDEQQFAKALNHSGLEDKINSLDKKAETNMLKILAETGIELSGGENQKLAMARALYKKGKILIMDEPTAALDPLAESELYQMFDDLIHQRTAIYISHRLSSTRFCDVITFIEDGKLKEYGSHEQLLVREGQYAKLFNMQARYYKEETVYEEHKDFKLLS